MNLDAFTRTSGEWLRGIGPDSDIVMSSRIRLARNLAQFPFINRCTESTLGEIEQLMRPIITNLPMQEKLSYLNVNKLSNLDRQFIVERQMISREHAERSGPRGVGLDNEENIGIMVNEEDHLRLQRIAEKQKDVAGLAEEMSDRLQERKMRNIQQPD